MTVSQDDLTQRIRAGIERLEVSQASLAEDLGIDQSAVSRSLAGRRSFKPLELAIVAEKLDTTVDALLGDGDTPSLAIAARRQADSHPVVSDAPGVDSALAQARQILELDVLLSDLGHPNMSVPRPSYDPAQSPHRQGEQLARKLRSKVGPPDDASAGDLHAVAYWMERVCGVNVGFRPLPAGLDGLSTTWRGGEVALVSSSVTPTRQLWTLAHELGHLVAGDVSETVVDDNVFVQQSEAEVRANAFAAEFLMPADVLTREFGAEPLNEERISNLLVRFGVSLEALAYRLHNLDLVTAEGRDWVRGKKNAHSRARARQATNVQDHNVVRYPLRLLQRALDAYADGQLSVRPIAQLLDTSVEAILEVLEPPESEAPPEVDTTGTAAS